MDWGGPKFERGRLPLGSREAVVDVELGYLPGDQIRLGDLDLTVVGTSTDTTYYFGLPTVFAPLRDVQEGFLNGQPLATALAVTGTRGRRRRGAAGHDTG